MGDGKFAGFLMMGGKFSIFYGLFILERLGIVVPRIRVMVYLHALIWMIGYYTVKI